MPSPRDSATYPSKAVQIGALLEKRLMAYVAGAGAAGIGLMAGTQMSEAKVIYTATYAEVPYPAWSLDFNHDGITDATISFGGDCSVSWCVNYLRVILPGNRQGAVGSQWIASALVPGELIGPNRHCSASAMAAGRVTRISLYSWAYGVFYDPWANNGNGVRDRYLGLKFFIGKEAHYGWVRISLQIPDKKSLAMTVRVTGYAYETTPGKAIVAGEETESVEGGLHAELSPMILGPSLGMLARGADGLVVWRSEP